MNFVPKNLTKSGQEVNVIGTEAVKSLTGSF